MRVEVMFAKFRINIDDVRKINASSTTGGIVNVGTYLLVEYCADALRQLIENEKGIIDGEKLKKDFFPTKDKKKFNVFISHSHSDIKEIEKFANILHKEYGVNCFVDSMVWKDIADLQYEIDDRYSRNTNGALDYKAVQQSTAHIHSLLSMALFEMIDQCECCIFVQSDNSLTLDFNNTLTLSPWIYEEIFYMNHTKDEMPIRLKEHYQKVLNETRLFDSGIKMNHVVDLKGFMPLSQSYLDRSVQGDACLTRLYVRSHLIAAKHC